MTQDYDNFVRVEWNRILEKIRLENEKGHLILKGQNHAYHKAHVSLDITSN